MKNLKIIVKNIFNVFRDFFTITPFSCIVILFCYVVNSIYPSLLTYYTAKLFENIEVIHFAEASQNAFYFNLLIFAGIYIIKNIFEMIINAPRSCGLYAKAKYNFNRRLAIHTTKIPYINFEKTETFEKLNRAQNCINSNIPQRLFFSTLELISLVIGVIGTSFVLISFNIWLLPLSILTVLPFFIVRIIRGKEFYKLKWFQTPKRRKMEYLWSLFIDKKSVKEIKVFKSNEYIYKNWRLIKEEVIDEEFEFIKKDGFSLLVCDLIRILGITCSAVLCTVLVVNQTLSIGQLAACFSAFILVQNMTKNIFENISNYNTNNKFISDYYDFIALKIDCLGDKEIDHIETINFENVSFKYPNSLSYALKSVTLSIKNGEKIAIVGKNGSGKTTLAKLLLNLFEPTSGSLKVNSMSLNEINKSSLYDLISIVSQNYIQYNMTLQENIIIGNYIKPVDEHQIDDLLYFLGLDKYTNQKSELLGKEFGGNELSGGEWQKIAIARGIYKDSELIILDEPTSALDPLIENEILNNFISMINDKTALIISHRIGLCKLVDKVIVMKEGEIVGVGTHEELISNNEYYKYLYLEQQKWYI